MPFEKNAKKRGCFYYWVDDLHSWKKEEILEFYWSNRFELELGATVKDRRVCTKYGNNLSCHENKWAKQPHVEVGEKSMEAWKEEVWSLLLEKGRVFKDVSRSTGQAECSISRAKFEEPFVLRNNGVTYSKGAFVGMVTKFLVENNATLELEGGLCLSYWDVPFLELYPNWSLEGIASTRPNPKSRGKYKNTLDLNKGFSKHVLDGEVDAFKETYGGRLGFDAGVFSDGACRSLSMMCFSIEQESDATKGVDKKHGKKKKGGVLPIPTHSIGKGLHTMTGKEFVKSCMDKGFNAVERGPSGDGYRDATFLSNFTVNGHVLDIEAASKEKVVLVGVTFEDCVLRFDSTDPDFWLFGCVFKSCVLGPMKEKSKHMDGRQHIRIVSSLVCGDNSKISPGPLGLFDRKEPRADPFMVCKPLSVVVPHKKHSPRKSGTTQAEKKKAKRGSRVLMNLIWNKERDGTEEKEPLLKKGQ